MSQTTDVLCAGVVVADHLCAPIERLPKGGEIIAAERMVLTLGGGAANTAVDLAKMGASAAVVGRVGDDDFGRIVANLLRKQEVDVSALQFGVGEETGQTLIINVRGDDRRFITSFGANSTFSAADIPPQRVKNCRVFYLGGYLVLPNMRQDAVAELFAAARQAGAKTVLDVAVSGSSDYLAQLERLLPHVDVFLPNADEAAQICGQSDVLRQAEQFRQLGAGTVVITSGGCGSVLVNDQVRLRAGTYPVEYVDGTGCGDAFDAGYIFGLLHRMSTEDCLRYATALGASCVRAVGTTPGVFTRDECEAFLRQHALQIESL
jgi:sugar/nucleoside kinase (ribokinase family)